MGSKETSRKLPRQHRRHFEYTERTVNVGERFYLKDELEKLLRPFLPCMLTSHKFMSVIKMFSTVTSQDTSNSTCYLPIVLFSAHLELHHPSTPILLHCCQSPPLQHGWHCLTQVLISWRADNRKATFSNSLLSQISLSDITYTFTNFQEETDI